MKTKSLLERKVQIAFGSAILTLAVVGSISYHGINVSNESARWVRHTHEVLASLENQLFAMESIDAGARGFILTGQESYLEFFHASVLRAQRGQAALRDLVVDYSAQQSKLPAPETLAGQKIQRAEVIIGLRRTEGLSAAADAIKSGIGQRMMDQFQGIIGELRDEELRLLALREVDAKRRLRQISTLLAVGTVLGLLIVAAAGWSAQRDSSARRRGENALSESEERYQMLLDGVEDYAIFMLDPQGKIVSWNGGAQRIKGYTADQIIGENFSSFFPPEDVERGRPEAILKITAANGPHEEQAVRVRKDGSRFLAALTFTALRGPAGILRGFSEVSRDLNEIKESGAKYRGLLEAAPDAMVVVNPEGEIVLLNAQAEKQFGYRRDELIGQQITSIIPEGFTERLVAEATRTPAEALAQQIGTGIDLFGRRKSGRKFPIEIMLSPLESADGILVTAAIRDITERRNQEHKIARLSRVRAVLSGINSAIVRMRDRNELFHEACRIAVEHGQFRMAWIGLVDKAAMHVEPVASARYGTDVLNLADLSFSGNVGKGHRRSECRHQQQSSHCGR